MKKQAASAVLLAISLFSGAVVGTTPAGAAADICVAANGAVRTQQGAATCAASGTGSVAIAKDGGNAQAILGDHNLAKALGENSFAIAGNGNFNTATASGNGSSAGAGDGNFNTATASGDQSGAVALGGDRNTATASGTGSLAEAELGNNQTATATSPGCSAFVAGTNGGTASC